MSKLLYLKASPREESFSSRAAEAFLDALRRAQPDVDVETLDLAAAELPPFDAPAAEAKYAVMGGQALAGPAEKAWHAVIGVIDRFRSADAYLIACPMWNFGIPYRLKHYVDLLVQPGLTFHYSPDEGYTGLVTGKKAVLILARGGTYLPPSEAAPLDFQRPYLEAILRFIGITDLRTLVIEPTLLAGPDAAQEALAKVIDQARSLAAEFA